MRAAAIVVLVVGIPLLWKWTPLSERVSLDAAIEWFRAFQRSPWAPAFILGTYVLFAVMFLPVNLLIFVTALFFSNGMAFLYVFGGVALNAAVGYVVGRAVGPTAVRFVDSKRLNNLADRVSKTNTWQLFLIRLVPVTPFSTLNVICGMVKLPVSRFFLATMASIAPGAVLIIFLERNVQRLFSQGDGRNGLIVAGLVLLILGGSVALKRWNRKRQIQP